MSFGLIALRSDSGAGMEAPSASPYLDASTGSASGGGLVLAPSGTYTSAPYAPATYDAGGGGYYSAYQAPAYQAPAAPAYAPVYVPPAYVSVYDLKRRQLGEGGEYTALDYPVLRFLHEGESLEKAALVRGPAQVSLKGPLIAAAVLFLLLR